MRLNITKSRYLARSNYEITGVTFETGGTITVPDVTPEYSELSLVNQDYVKKRLENVETDVNKLVTVLNKHNYPIMAGEFTKDESEDYIFRELHPVVPPRVISVSVNNKGMITGFNDYLDLSKVTGLSFDVVDRETLPGIPQDYLTKDRILRFLPFDKFNKVLTPAEEIQSTISPTHLYNTSLIGPNDVPPTLSDRNASERLSYRETGKKKEEVPYWNYPTKVNVIMGTTDLDLLSKQRHKHYNMVRDNTVGDLVRITPDTIITSLVSPTDETGMMTPHAIKNDVASPEELAKKSIYQLLYNQGGNYTATKSSLVFGKGYINCKGTSSVDITSYVDIAPGAKVLTGGVIIPVSKDRALVFGGGIPGMELTEKEIALFSSTVSEYTLGEDPKISTSDIKFNIPIRMADAVAYGEWTILRNFDGKYYKIKTEEVALAKGKDTVTFELIKDTSTEPLFKGPSCLTVMGNTLVSGFFDENAYVYEIFKDGLLKYRGLYSEVFGEEDVARGSDLRPSYPFSQIHYEEDGGVTVAATHKDYYVKMFGGFIGAGLSELYGKHAHPHRSGHFEIISNTEKRRAAFSSTKRLYNYPTDVLPLNGILYSAEKDGDGAIRLSRIDPRIINNNSILPTWAGTIVPSYGISPDVKDYSLYGLMSPGFLLFGATSRMADDTIEFNAFSLGYSEEGVGFKLAKLTDVFGMEFEVTRPDIVGGIEGAGFRLPCSPSVYQGGLATPTFVQGTDYGGYTEIGKELQDTYLEDRLTPIVSALNEGKGIVYRDVKGEIKIKQVLIGGLTVIDDAVEILDWDNSITATPSATTRLSVGSEHLVKVPDHGPKWLINYTDLFKDASSFDQDLSTWDVSRVQSMKNLFNNAVKFNGDISLWDVSNVTDFSGMFSFAKSFNTPLVEWDTSKALSMAYMFREANVFNQDIGEWDVSSVTNMYAMFANASVFNYDLTNWCVRNIPTKPESFDLDADNWTELRPIWGTCNGRNALLYKDTKGMIRSVPIIGEDIIITDAVEIIRWGYNDNIFNKQLQVGSSHLVKVPNVEPVWTTNFSNMFKDATKFNQDLSQWDVSNVTNMYGMFVTASMFNGNVSTWDVSKVVFMRDMFNGAVIFNQDLSEWDVGSVTHMSSMFKNAKRFSGDISKWNVSSVTTAEAMFHTAESFNSDISKWDVSSLTTMSDMFFNALLFNSDISKWDVSNVKIVHSLFHGARAFNQDISKWDVSKVTDMTNMFNEAVSFNQNLSKWNVSNVTLMTWMFGKTASFNGDITTWNTSNLVNMSNMFNGASKFNQDISKWNTSKVTNTLSTFRDATAFNQDISTWDVSGVTDMSRMFKGASAFNQNLSPWCVSQFTEMPLDFDHSTPNWIKSRPIWGMCPTGNEIIYIDKDDVLRLRTIDFPSTTGGTLVIDDAKEIVNWGWEEPSKVKSSDNIRVGSVHLIKVPEHGPMWLHNYNSLFHSATNFNQDLNTWDMSHVKNIGSMFSGAAKFNGDVSNWDVSNVTYMREVFNNASKFNGDISLWDVSKVTNFRGMFSGASSFNTPLIDWNVSKATDMRHMFHGTKAFNQDISKWNVSNVTDMALMFASADVFNQDLWKWDVSNVTAMDQMFSKATAFNQDLSGWCVVKIGKAPTAFDSSATAWTKPRPVWGTCPEGTQV